MTKGRSVFLLERERALIVRALLNYAMELDHLAQLQRGEGFEDSANNDAIQAVACRALVECLEGEHANAA